MTRTQGDQNAISSDTETKEGAVSDLPVFDPTPAQQAPCETLVRELAVRANVFVRLTEVYQPRPDGTIVNDEATFQARLSYLYPAFGEDRVLFGTDYPNSHGVATIQDAAALMRFFADKPLSAAERYFWRNSARIYKWKPRAADQPRLA